MKKERLFVRNFEAGEHLETFLVAAVASILIIRLFLEVTGYPKLGGASLHIAHVLWGGLMMVAASTGRPFERGHSQSGSVKDEAAWLSTSLSWPRFGS